MKFNRRKLMLASGALGISAFGAKHFSSFVDILANGIGSQANYIYGFGRNPNHPYKKFFLAIVDLNSPEKKINHIPMSFFGHGIAFHPLKKNILSVFQKVGPGGCEIDLLTGEERPLEPHPGRYFYGHGLYFYEQSPARSASLSVLQRSGIANSGRLKILCTESEVSRSRGWIAVRDAETLKLEYVFSSYGHHPHDCTLTADGSALAVTNGGSFSRQSIQSSVSYIDLKTKKLLDKFVIEDSRFDIAHLAISKNKDLVALAKPYPGQPDTGPGAIALLSNPIIKGAKLHVIQNPKNITDQLKGETLSVCIDDQRGLFAATSPLGHLVTYWNLKTGEYLASTPITKPNGVTMTKNKKYFIVNYMVDTSHHLAFINADSFKHEEAMTISNAGIAGSHLYRV